ncbi:MAG: DUF1329 domain-containing protein [Myxococcales bacterium]
MNQLKPPSAPMMRARPPLAALIAASLAVSVGVGQLVSRAGADTATIKAETWGESVGFKPDLQSIPVQPGATVDKSNVATLKGLVPAGLETLISKYNLTLKVVPYVPFRPSDGYIAATNENRGKTRLKDVGKEFRTSGRNDFFPGLPFPQPKTGLEVAANFLGRYGGDDFEVYYDTLWISAKSGVEHTEYWHWASVKGVNRTDIDPRPRIQEIADQRMVGTSYTEAIEPYDKKGFGALYSSSFDPVDIQGHVYVPAMRRVLRNSFGTRGDSWNATDFLYEDVNGYLGAVEWMNWKLEGKKTMLMPAHPGVKHGNDPKLTYDLDRFPHWNPKINWEARPVYVLSATPKFPDYPYSRMLMVVDAESYVMYYKEAFDKKGELWKIILSAPKESPDPKTQPGQMGASCAIDLQAEHATCVHARKARANSGQDLSKFTVSALRKRGH